MDLLNAPPLKYPCRRNIIAKRTGSGRTAEDYGGAGARHSGAPARNSESRPAHPATPRAILSLGLCNSTLQQHRGTPAVARPKNPAQFDSWPASSTPSAAPTTAPCTLGLGLQQHPATAPCSSTLQNHLAGNPSLTHPFFAFRTPIAFSYLGKKT